MNSGEFLCFPAKLSVPIPDHNHLVLCVPPKFSIGFPARCFGCEKNPDALEYVIV